MLVSVSIESIVNKSKFCLQFRVIKIQTVTYKHMHHQIGHTEGKQPSTNVSPHLAWPSESECIGKTNDYIRSSVDSVYVPGQPNISLSNHLWLWGTYRQYPHISNRSIFCGATRWNRRWGWYNVKLLQPISLMTVVTDFPVYAKPKAHSLASWERHGFDAVFWWMLYSQCWKLSNAIYIFNILQGIYHVLKPLSQKICEK